jgi:arylsulfatase A-like enzyme
MNSGNLAAPPERNFMSRLLLAILLLAAFAAPARAQSKAPRRPNVILIMTDDQGYGDLACHGNPILQTPNLDKLHRQSTRLTNFHVDPTCSPTRSALLTGRYSSRTGVWHTVMGRSLLRRDETTLANIFAAQGYRTGIFGKWHLGDNFPFRPQERGFHEALTFGGGAISNTPDFWGNNYFDDTLRRNNKLEKFAGYCTDVFFAAAQRFIEENRDRPFFAYIPTNAPHQPYNVAAKYSKPYADRGVPSPRAEFYGMIANIDENVGRLLERVRALGLEDDTIVIFMTDNGTAAGYNENTRAGFNAGMRGFKGSEYDGGHRVPCFLRWPGRLRAGADVGAVTAHIDIVPTLLDLCGLQKPADIAFDGVSLRSLLAAKQPWPSRTLLVHSQRIDHPEPWRKCAVMTDRWRLVNGKELYDMTTDPGAWILPPPMPTWSPNCGSPTSAGGPTSPSASMSIATSCWAPSKRTSHPSAVTTGMASLRPRDKIRSASGWSRMASGPCRSLVPVPTRSCYGSSRPWRRSPSRPRPLASRSAASTSANPCPRARLRSRSASRWPRARRGCRPG